MRCLGNVVDGSYFASDGGHVLFPIQSDTDFKLMMEVVKRGAKANFDKGARSCDDVHTSNVSRIQTAFAAQALRIIHLNVKSICGPQASKKASEKGEQTLHLNSTVSWSTSTSYRDYIKDVLQLVIRNPAVYPNSSLGAYAIEFASLSALTPVASQQFAVVCSLLDRVETGSATPCENELLLAQMRNLEGPKLLELLRSSLAATLSGSGDSSSEGTQFLSSLLSLTSRSLEARVSQQESSRFIGDDRTRGTQKNNADTSANTTTYTDTDSIGDSSSEGVQEVLHEVVLNVLEPITVQVTSMLILQIFACLHKMSASNQDSALQDNQDVLEERKHEAAKNMNCLVSQKFVPVITHFMQSAVSAIHVITRTTGTKSSCSVNSGAERVKFVHDYVGKSHTSHLVPLVLFAVGLFWDELHRLRMNDAQVSECSKLLLPLQEPLTQLQAALNEAIKHYEQAISSLKRDRGELEELQPSNDEYTVSFFEIHQ